MSGLTEPLKIHFHLEIRFTISVPIFNANDIAEVLRELQSHLKRPDVNQTLFGFSWPESLEEHQQRMSNSSENKESLKEKLIAVLLEYVDIAITETNMRILSENTISKAIEYSRNSAYSSNSAGNPSKSVNSKNDKVSECHAVIANLSDTFFPEFLTRDEEMECRRLCYFQLGRTLASLCLSLSYDVHEAALAYFTSLIDTIDIEIIRLQHVSSEFCISISAGIIISV